MRAHFGGFEQYAIAEADVPENEINGSGGTAAPLIWLPMRIDISHRELQERDALEIVSVSGKLTTSNGFSLSSHPVFIETILTRKFSRLHNHPVYLEFPQDKPRLDELERLRAGGNLKLRLDAVLHVKSLFALGEKLAGPVSRPVWGYVSSHRLHLQTELTVPREAWTARVLPNVGYGSVLTVEFPAIPVQGSEKLSHSFQALHQAQELHKLGHFDDAVGKCRVALDPFFDWIEKAGDDGVVRRIPILKRSWETQLGQATYAWLNDATRAIKEAANPTHHQVAPHYDQLESQMVFAITAALVSYAARNVQVGDR